MEPNDWISLLGLVVLLFWNVIQHVSLNKQKQNLENLKLKNDIEMKALEAKHEVLLFKKKASFEHEFNLYKRIWTDLYKVGDALGKFESNLKIYLELKEEGKLADKNKQEQIDLGKKVLDVFEIMKKEIECNRPFYASKIRELLWNLLTSSSNYFRRQLLKFEGEDYLADMHEISKKIDKLTSKIENVIRERLNDIS